MSSVHRWARRPFVPGRRAWLKPHRRAIGNRNLEARLRFGLRFAFLCRLVFLHLGRCPHRPPVVAGPFARFVELPPVSSPCPPSLAIVSPAPQPQPSETRKKARFRNSLIVPTVVRAPPWSLDATRVAALLCLLMSSVAQTTTTDTTLPKLRPPCETLGPAVTGRSAPERGGASPWPDAKFLREYVRMRLFADSDRFGASPPDTMARKRLRRKSACALVCVG